jgi:hypothetical protein
MGATVTRSITLSLDRFEFGWQALQSAARRLNVDESQILQEAVMHYLDEGASGRQAWRLPRFATADHWGRGGDIDLTVELEADEWSRLEAAAAEQDAPLDAVVAHAVSLFLADLDSGRLPARILDHKED